MLEDSTQTSFLFDLSGGQAGISVPVKLTALDIRLLKLRIEVLEKEVALKERDNDMVELLNIALDNLIWCSGSADFGPEGQAHEGWKKGPQKTIEKLLAFLGLPGESDEPEVPETEGGTKYAKCSGCGSRVYLDTCCACHNKFVPCADKPDTKQATFPASGCVEHTPQAEKLNEKTNSSE
jgi:hypothetical protein